MEGAINFELYEFFPPGLYLEAEKKGTLSELEKMLDPRIPKIAQFYRDHFNSKVIINDWHYRGQLSLRGFRPKNTKIGAKFSQHKLGKAFDCHFDKVSHIDVYHEIVNNPKPFMDIGLTTLENIDFTSTWLHSDVRVTGQKGLLIVNP